VRGGSKPAVFLGFCLFTTHPLDDVTLGAHFWPNRLKWTYFNFVTNLFIYSSIFNLN
jgi:hypothetical protein